MNLTDDMFENCKQIRCTRGPLITDVAKGEILCGTCGQVLVDKTEDPSVAPAIHDMNDYLTKSRTGPASRLAIHDRGLNTNINNTNKDASGNPLSGYVKGTFDRLRIWDHRSKSTGSDRNFTHAFILLETMKTKLAIPDSVAEETAYIYRKAVAKKMTQGRSIPSMLCASLYAACRATNTPRTLRDIARAANIRKGVLALSYRILIKTLDLKFKPYDPAEFVTRVAASIGVSEKTRRDALNILLKAEKMEICAGKHPMGLVGAAIYLSSTMNMEKGTQQEIAKACGITNVTIRNMCKFLIKSLNNEIREFKNSMVVQDADESCRKCGGAQIKIL